MERQNYEGKKEEKRVKVFGQKRRERKKGSINKGFWATTAVSFFIYFYYLCVFGHSLVSLIYNLGSGCMVIFTSKVFTWKQEQSLSE